MSCKWTTHGIKHSLSMHQINSEYDERDPCLARIKKSFVRGGDPTLITFLFLLFILVNGMER